MFFLPFFYIALLIAFFVFASSISWVFKLYFFAINAATLVAYFIDKGRAQCDERRIPEITLHAMCLLGGVTGAELGRTFARHKTRKLSFRLVILLGMFEMLTIAMLMTGHVVQAPANGKPATAQVAGSHPAHPHRSAHHESNG